MKPELAHGGVPTGRTLRSLLLLALSEHGITAEEIVRDLPDDALGAVADAVRRRVMQRRGRLDETCAGLAAGEVGR